MFLQSCRVIKYGRKTHIVVDVIGVHIDAKRHCARLFFVYPNVKLLFNIMKDYTKISLRDLRQNLTQVKDSLALGQAYEVTQRGISLGYLLPREGYKIKKEVKKEKKMTQEEWVKFVHSLIGCAELKDEIKQFDDYMDGYRYLLEKKYLRK